MKRRGVCCIVALAFCVVVPGTLVAQDASTTIRTDIPIVVPADQDSSWRQRPQVLHPAPPFPTPPSTKPQIISVEPGTPTNATKQFQYRDVTERPEARTRQKSMAERRAAVEAYRQSLPRGGSAPR